MQTRLPDPAHFNEAVEKAFADFQEGNFEAAEPVLKNALLSLGQDKERSNRCLEQLIEISQVQGRYGEAIRQTLRLLSVLKSDLGELDDKVIARSEQLARLYEAAGYPKEAEYMYNRVARLKAQLVEAPPSEDQEAIWSNSHNKTETDSDIGPDPNWLIKAFEEANQAYGDATGNPEKAALAIFVPEEAPTGHYFRPANPESKQGSNLLDFTDFGKRTNEASESYQSALRAKTEVSKFLQPPSSEKNNSGITPMSSADKAAYRPAEGPRKLQNLYSNHKPEHKVSRLQSKPQRHLENPVTFRTAEVAKHNAGQGNRSKRYKALKTKVFEAPSARKEKRAGSQPGLTSNQRGAQTESKDIIWRLGKMFNKIQGGLAMPATTSDGAYNHHGHGSKYNPPGHNSKYNRPLTPVASTKPTVRRYKERVPPPPPESALLSGLVHRTVSMLDKVKQKDNLGQIMVTVIIICFALLALADRYIPRRISPTDVFSQMPCAYRTASGDTQLRLLDPTACQFTVGDTNTYIPCNLYLGDWRDCINISFSALFQKQHWMLRTAEGLKSYEGPVLYSSGGPELQIVDRMEYLAHRAASIYVFTAAYPTKAADIPRGRAAYVNPFTKKVVRPAFERLYFETNTDPLGRDRALREGTRLPSESDIQPGSINCYSLTFQTPNLITQSFYIRGYDRVGKQISGSSPGATYFLVLKDGCRVQNDLGAPSFLRWSPRKHTLWLIDGNTDPFTLAILSQAGAFFFAALCLLFVLLKKVLQPDKTTKKTLNFMIPACGVVAGLYLFAHWLP